MLFSLDLLWSPPSTFCDTMCIFFNVQVFIIYTNIYTYFRCILIHDIVPIPYFCGLALSSPSGGDCLWSFHLDGHAFAAPCVTKDMAYIATHGQTLFAISLSLGTFFWWSKYMANRPQKVGVRIGLYKPSHGNCAIYFNPGVLPLKQPKWVVYPHHSTQKWGFVR